LKDDGFWIVGVENDEQAKYGMKLIIRVK